VPSQAAEVSARFPESACLTAGAGRIVEAAMTWMRPRGPTPPNRPPRRGSQHLDQSGQSASRSAATTANTAHDEHPVLHLQGTVGNRAVTDLLVQRHVVAGTTVHRHTRADLFDPPGTTFEDFHRSVRRQADWFAEPTLTAADRTDLHALLQRAAAGPQVIAGVGDILLADLRAVSSTDWAALEAFGRGCQGTGTVQIADASAYTLANRIKLGKTLLALEAVIPPGVLHRAVAEAQLVDVDSGGLVPKIAAYWAAFSPHVEATYEPGPGAKAEEFELVLDLVKRTGHTPFLSLVGRIRNLHRLTEPALLRLKANFADHSRSRRVDLVLLTGHDRSGSFLSDRPLLEDLVVNSPNLVLVLEGQASLAAITAEIPNLAAAYGKPDASGTPRLGQVMISGHGSARSVELAGTGPPDATGNYPSESIDLDRNLVQSKALIDALLTNMDPATAKVVFNGCLVGANPVPAGTPAASIAGHIGAQPSLATYVQQRAGALGLPPGFTTLAARASVSAPSSFRDASGDLAFNYPRDPDAFGTAAGYVATGIEPEGLFTAAVEVAALSSPATAETLLRSRLGRPAVPTDWWDICTRALVTVALRPIAAGAGITAERLNGFAHLASTPFLSHWGGDFGISTGSWVANVNPHPDAADIYTTIVATSFVAAPADQKARIGRFTLEQGWLAAGGARIAPMITFLDGTPAPTFTARTMEQHLDTVELAGQSSALFPVGGPTSSGRLRLALAWLFADSGNADVRAYLNGQVNTPPTGPELSPALTAELGGIVDSEVLEKLGRLTATVPPSTPGAAPLPAANAEVDASGTNKVRIEPRAYQATVQVVALNVRTKPGMHGQVFVVVHQGDVLDVAGFTHNWAAADINGRLGFVHRTMISAP
jgi:hypothetical protein